MADESNIEGANSRIITVKGKFNNTVIISDSLANGQNCTCPSNDTPKYSHAEGKGSVAEGLYSHADGYNAHAESDYSFVWSGRIAQNTTNKDNGESTYSIYTNDARDKLITDYKNISGDSDDRFDSNANLLSYMRQTCASNIYINGIKLSDTFNVIKRWAVSSVRTESNTFTGTEITIGKTKVDDNNYSGLFVIQPTVTTTINGPTTITGNLTTNGSITIAKPNQNSAISATISVPATFKDSVTFESIPKCTSTDEVDVGTNDGTFATCNFVHSVVQAYLKAALGNDIIKS